MRRFLPCFAACAALLAAAADDGGKAQKAKKPSGPPDFHVVCSNAWLTCLTDKPLYSYATGEDMKFSFVFRGVTNDVPKGEFFWSWKRTGDDGAEESGKAPLEPKKLDVTARTGTPGFVRVAVEIVEKDGKPFKAKGAKGKPDRNIAFTAGACAGFDKIEPRPAPKDFAKKIADAKRRLARVQFRKYEKTPVEDSGLDGFKLFSVSVPCEGETPLTGYLAIPEDKEEAEAPKSRAGAKKAVKKRPARIMFAPCPPVKAQAKPSRKSLKPGEMTLVAAYDPGKPETRDEAFCTSLFLRVARAVQFVKSLPGWNGVDLTVEGWHAEACLAIWAAACGEGVSKVECGAVQDLGKDDFSLPQFARLVPEGCMIQDWREFPSDAGRSGADAARLWNALGCDRRTTWVQGASRWYTPNFKGAAVAMEKIRPLQFKNFTPERLVAGKHVEDLELAFRDKIVIELAFDYTAKPLFDPAAFGELYSQLLLEKSPVAAYAFVPDAKPKPKAWQKYVDVKFGKGETWRPSFPVYASAGVALPPPPEYPWCRVIDAGGVLRYEGPDVARAGWFARDCARKMPAPDPMFAYAPPVLLKDEIEKMQKAKFNMPRILKSIEMLKRKYAQSDPARAEEAAHVALGMKQALERRFADASKLLEERPGRAIADFQTIVAEWPTAANHPLAARAKTWIGNHPEYEKLAKLEKEMDRLFAWNPEKKADIKKKEDALAVLRAKASKFEKSKDPLAQGEAMAILADLDNPPDAQQQDPAQDAQQGN